MLLNSTLQKTLTPLGKFGLWLGITTIASNFTDNAQISQMLAAIGIESSRLKDICEIVKGISSNRISDYYKEIRDASGFSISHHLQNAIRTGINNAVNELSKSFIKVHDLSQADSVQIERFFSSLSYQLSTVITKDFQINDYITDRPKFFISLLKLVNEIAEYDTQGTTHTKVFQPELDDQILQKLAFF